MYKDLCMKLYLNMLQILNFQKVLSENKEFTPASQITYLSFIKSVESIRDEMFKILEKEEVTESQFLKFYEYCKKETLDHQIVDGVKNFFTIYLAPICMLFILINQAL